MGSAASRRDQLRKPPFPRSCEFASIATLALAARSPCDMSSSAVPSRTPYASVAEADGSPQRREFPAIVAAPLDVDRRLVVAPLGRPKRPPVAHPLEDLHRHVATAVVLDADVTSLHAQVNAQQAKSDSWSTRSSRLGSRRPCGGGLLRRRANCGRCARPSSARLLHRTASPRLDVTASL
jgi:hypothetical protein